jgi:hypothetical protein
VFIVVASAALLTVVMLLPAVDRPEDSNDPGPEGTTAVSASFPFLDDDDDDDDDDRDDDELLRYTFRKRDRRSP